MIYDKLKADLLVMRKTKAKKEANLLTFLIGEVDRAGKDHSDKALIVILQRIRKQLEKGIIVDQVEIDTISNYLPKDLTEAEMVSVLRMNPHINNIGMAMKELKTAATAYGKTVNGKLASILIQKHLS